MAKVRRRSLEPSPNVTETKTPLMGRREIETSKEALELLRIERYKSGISLMTCILNRFLPKKRTDR